MWQLICTFRRRGIWIALSMMAPIGMLVLSGLVLSHMRRDAWAKADKHARNFAQVLGRDVDRNLELFDLSIAAAVENLRLPDLNGLSASTRQLILFDRAAAARDMGAMIIVEESDIVAERDSMPPRKGNYADRDYCRAYKSRAGLGLFVGRPLVSRLTGERMLLSSRRITNPDGSFGGVVMGSIKLSYFTRLFSRIGFGRHGAIGLYLRDGTQGIRQPYVAAAVGADMTTAGAFRRFDDRRDASFVAVSAWDGIEKLYAPAQVGDLPLVVSVDLSTEEIVEEWRAKALVIGRIVLPLGGLAVGLTLLFAHEMRHREAI